MAAMHRQIDGAHHGLAVRAAPQDHDLAWLGADRKAARHEDSLQRIDIAGHVIHPRMRNLSADEHLDGRRRPHGHAGFGMDQDRRKGGA